MAPWLPVRRLFGMAPVRFAYYFICILHNNLILLVLLHPHRHDDGVRLKFCQS